jgi:hypothetical protein
VDYKRNNKVSGIHARDASKCLPISKKEVLSIVRILVNFMTGTSATSSRASLARLISAVRDSCND